MEVHWGAEIQLQSLEKPTLEQVLFLIGPVACGGPTLEQPVSEGLHPVEKRPTWQQFVKNCCPWDGLILKKFVKDCVPWGGTPQGASGGFLSLSSGRNNL
ncbi:hypothetical protein WISP_116706 [Willisornis vidua]|uniref:Uncharacterized protein n=1 Tax=Willisornis vidua TaxID=1566151 RepID=A0ABQ9CYD6_9PASS|nr:hypothetical protein WISP_116706 [Willisornis vidua]